MGIETTSSWRELDDAIADTSWCVRGPSVRATLVFRGLARSDYSNVSSLARLGGDFSSLEPHLIRNFRKYAHRERPGPTTWDWLSLAQHHGLPTRLLDWTFSPFVALHFATVGWPAEEGVLWAVDCDRVHEELPENLRAVAQEEGALVFTTELLAGLAPDLPSLDAMATGGDAFALFFEPPSLDDRIINQAAVMSVIADADRPMDDWLEAHPDAWRAWRLPPDVKAEVRERLDQANITERVLLPGLDGLASWLRRYYSPVRADQVLGGGGSMAESER